MRTIFEDAETLYCKHCGGVRRHSFWRDLLPPFKDCFCAMSQEYAPAGRHPMPMDLRAMQARTSERLAWDRVRTWCDLRQSSKAVGYVGYADGNPLARYLIETDKALPKRMMWHVDYGHAIINLNGRNLRGRYCLKTPVWTVNAVRMYWALPERKGTPITCEQYLALLDKCKPDVSV